MESISVAEVFRGQTGYGETVFSGTELQRFDVEVVGVLRDFNPGLSFILAKLSGHGLEESGVAGGMSGSPVYLDGRLAGAVAFSWDFSNGALAGITPIESMRDLSGLPLVSSPLAGARNASAGTASGSAPASPAIGSDVDYLSNLIQALHDPQSLDPGILDREFLKLSPHSMHPGGVSGMQVAAAGFGLETRGRLERAAGGLAPSGRVQDGAKLPALAAGSAVSAILIGGDFELAVNGTVTERHGEEVLAFGHPWLGIGPMSVPMAAAEVVTIVSSRMSSFKVSNLGPVIGAFDQDRLPGMRGQVGAVARTTPMTVRVQRKTVGGEDSGAAVAYDLELADLSIMRPTLVAISMLQSLEAAGRGSGDQSLELSGKLTIAGYGDLEIRQSFEGTGAGTGAAIYLLSLVGFLEFNTFADVEVESIEIEVAQFPVSRQRKITGVVPSRREVRPGDSVKLFVELEEYRGDSLRRELEVEVPPGLSEGSYFLFVGDGASVDAARLQLEPAESKSLRESLDLLASFNSKSDLVALGARRSTGLVTDGRILPNLPGSMRVLYSQVSGPAPKRLPLEVTNQVVSPGGVPMDGLVRVDLTVLPPRADEN